MCKLGLWLCDDRDGRITAATTELVAGVNVFDKQEKAAAA